MAYQTAGYPASSWAGSTQDSAYYAQYYAAYGYGGSGYDYNAYYQQQQQYAPADAGASSEQQSAKAPDAGSSGSAPPPPPPPSSSSDVPPPAPPGSPPPADATASGDSAKPPPPPAGPPPPSELQAGSNAQQEQAAPAAQFGSAETSTASGYDSAAYAQWYAQTYGAYYGAYPGYDQQQHYAYWQQQQQQQQQQQPYAYPSAYQQPTSVPPPAPPKEEPPERSKQGSVASSSGFPGSYNAQPPPSNLYNQQPAYRAQQQHGRQPTGANTVPIGPRPPPGDPPASASPAGTSVPTAQHTSRFRSPMVIRPQMPVGRPSTSAVPAYIPVGSSQPAAAGTSAAATNASVAAAVAAGAASAAAAAAKASTPQSSPQWPPSFTAWVTRCFNTARLKNIPDNRLSEKLMAYLDRVKADGKLWITDWDTHPVMLPDSPSDAQHAASPAGQILSPAAPQSRKRSRWGAVVESHASPDAQQPQHHQQRHYERSQDADTDEEDHGHGHHGSRSTPHKAHGQGQHAKHASASPHDVGQHLSKKQRKKLLQQQLHQNQQPQNKRAFAALNTAEEMRRRARAGRFGDGRADGTGPAASNDDSHSSGMDMSDDEEVAVRRWSGGVVVGTCQALEKSYFRLTSQPDPATVRPEPVLERALERLVGLIARGEATYFYSLDQFKGMRQDCTVQHLRNALSVRVYEAHARSSLEYGDLAEFNQCQARLGHLYAEGQPGCLAEFTAYRLLYETAHCATAAGRSGGMAKSLLHTMRNVPRELAGTAEVRHALQVREAVMTNNYAGFFRLYATAPHLGRAVMDSVAEPMRYAGLNAFVKACDLPLPVAAMAQLLGFTPRPVQPQEKAQPDDSEAEGERRPLPGCMRAHLRGDAAAAGNEEEGVAVCAAWLREHGAVVTEKGSELLLDTKASRGKLFVPEVTAKVAHGDENLSVNDFLSRAQRNLAD